MEEQMEELEAEQVYLLMRKEYRISRNVRAQWYFNHLDQLITVPKRHHLVSQGIRAAPPGELGYHSVTTW